MSQSSVAPESKANEKILCLKHQGLSFQTLNFGDLASLLEAHKRDNPDTVLSGVRSGCVETHFQPSNPNHLVWFARLRGITAESRVREQIMVLNSFFSVAASIRRFFSTEIVLEVESTQVAFNILKYQANSLNIVIGNTFQEVTSDHPAMPADVGPSSTSESQTCVCKRFVRQGQ